MSVELTVTLPDNVYQRAQRLAQLTGRDVGDILTTMLELSLPPLIPRIDTDQPVSVLSDDEVLALTELQMSPEKDKRLSDLLYKQQADDLNEAESIEFQALMRVYEIGMVRKAQGLAEAVKRGLREPLES